MLSVAMSVQVEQEAQERAWRRGLGDPERAWAVEADLNRSALEVDLAGLRRAARALVMAVVSLF
jgi:hypothetical protein